MSWQATARERWAAHQEAERETEERDAEQAVKHLVKRCDLLSLPYGNVLASGGHVRVRLLPDPAAEEPHLWELRCVVTDPEIRAWVLPVGGVTWIDRGRVETLADLGRALDAQAVPPGEPEPEQSTGDLMLQVVTGLVREVVADELDGRLGHGAP